MVFEYFIENFANQYLVEIITQLEVLWIILVLLRWVIGWGITYTLMVGTNLGQCFVHLECLVDLEHFVKLLVEEFCFVFIPSSLGINYVHYDLGY